MMVPIIIPQKDARSPTYDILVAQMIYIELLECPQSKSFEVYRIQGC